MIKDIKKVAVIGAGTMGAGIAAQLANAGVEVVLLDLTKDKADAAVQRMLKAKPTDAFNNGFMAPENAKLITTGSSVDNLDMIADCDWVIESILVKDPQIRQDLYKRAQAIARPDAIFSSNTSMDTTVDMTYDQDDDFKSRFLNAHFFNPVRYMHLLEVIPNPDHTDPACVEAIRNFGDKVLGKKVVECKDVVGFIGNRIGIYAMERALQEALLQNIKIEDVDAIMGKAFGFPFLGLFKLADEVGLDVVQHVREGLVDALPDSDDFMHIYTGHERLQNMIDDGYVGNRKEDSLGGYYRTKTDADGNVVKDAKGKPVKQALRLDTGEYEDRTQSPFFKFERHIKKVGGYQNFFDSHHEATHFAWPVLRDIMIYVLDHAEELAFDVQAIDDAMRAGFNWEYGPFELMDQFGLDWFRERLEKEDIATPALLDKAGKSFYRENGKTLEVMSFDGSYSPVRREDGVIKLEDHKRGAKPLVATKSAKLWDIGDGVTCLEFTSPMNSLEPSVLKGINDSIKFMTDNGDRYKAMVVYNDADSFSIGANLVLINAFMKAANHGITKALGLSGFMNRKVTNFVGNMVYQGQAVLKAMREAPFPVIGAPKGTPKNMSLGGGCEVLLWSDAIQAGPEAVIALVEAGAGLIPGWGGTTRYLDRATKKPGQKGGPMPPVIEATLALANPMESMSMSAQDAKKKLWLQENDGISMNPDRVLADAKARALEMAVGYEPPKPSTFRLPGPSGKAAIRMKVDDFYLRGDDPKKGGVNHVDVKVAEGLADILTGGETLTADQVDTHLAAHHDHVRDIIARKPAQAVKINPTLELTEQRLLALEWQRIMTLATDGDTQARIAHIATTGKPLREPHLDPAPTPGEIRNSIKLVPMFDKVPDGKPLTGADAERLDEMAEITETALRGQIPKTLMKLVMMK